MIEYGDTRLPERFWKKVRIDGKVEECWTWLGAIKERGHGQCAVYADKEKTTTALVAIGQYIYEVDRETHKAVRTCTDAACVNPNHVMVVGKNECKRGHKDAKKYSNGQCSACRALLDKNRDKKVLAERARKYREGKSSAGLVSRKRPGPKPREKFAFGEPPPTKVWRPEGWPEEILGGKLKVSA